MTEHQIATWRRSNGTWEVTHKKSVPWNDSYLFDDPVAFKDKFKSRSEAKKYALKLFKKYSRPTNIVSLADPNLFGQEVENNKGWQHFKGKIKYKEFKGKKYRED